MLMTLQLLQKDPQAFCHELKKKYNIKLKGVGPLEYHLGCTYKKDPDGTLVADPRRYVNKIVGSAHRLQSRHFWSNHTLGPSEMRSQAPQF